MVGLPGIGKTTFVVKCLVNMGCTIRWANASKYSDIYSICGMADRQNIPQDEASIVELIAQNFANDYR